jgi:T5orf172 domain
MRAGRKRKFAPLGREPNGDIRRPGRGWCHWSDWTAERRTANPDSGCAIYVMTDDEQGTVKIGSARILSRRVQEIGRYHIRLFWAARGPENTIRVLEKLTHASLKKGGKLVKGTREWYNMHAHDAVIHLKIMAKKSSVDLEPDARIGWF